MRDRLISKHREAIQRSDFYLEGTNGLRLEAQIGLEILSNLTDQSLEWEFADQQLSWLLVTADLTESNGTWSVAMGLLDATSRWGRFTGGLDFKINKSSVTKAKNYNL